MLIAVYGSLRRGCSNSYFLRGGKLLSTERVDGFEMHNLSNMYPYINRAADSITVEVYEVPSQQVEPIERMETGAGYAMTGVKTSLGMALIFYMEEASHENMQSEDDRPPKVLSGDWVEWLKKYRPNSFNVTEEQEYQDAV